MEILSLLPGLYEKFLLFVLIFTRISALFYTFVLFKRENITLRVIVALTAILSIYTLFYIDSVSKPVELFSFQMFLYEIFQMAIGLLAGLILNILFDIFVAIGQIISTQIGLSMASLIDQRFGYITSLTHCYVMIGTLVFLYLNGHLFAIKLIIESFIVLPPFYEQLNGNVLFSIANYAGVIFSYSIMICLIIIIVNMITNISISVVGKFAPQFNIFTIGINFQLIIGLICIYLTFNLLVNYETNFIEKGMNYMETTFVKLR